MIKRCFKEDIERKKITVPIVWGKKAKLQKLNKYLEVQLCENVKYMIQPPEKSECQNSKKNVKRILKNLESNQAV